MPVEPGVVDANVLAYAMNADAAQHRSSRALLEMARTRSATLYVTSQILCEFYSIITNERRYPRACSASEGVRILSALLALPGLHVLPAPVTVVQKWIELLQRYPVTRAEVFDLQIAGTMMANGISRIYTFNTADFVVIPELSVTTPEGL